MEKIIKYSILLIFCVLVVNVKTKSTNLSNLRSDPNYKKLLEEFKKISSRKSKDELRMIATIGLISGALETMKNMEEHLTEMVSDLILNLDITDKTTTMPKIEKVEYTLERDKRAIEILGNALDLARRNITNEEYRRRIKQLARDYYQYRRQLKQKQTDIDMREKIDDLKTKILEHMDMMHTVIGSKTNATLNYLQSVQYRQRKRNGNSRQKRLEAVENSNQTTTGFLPTKVPHVLKVPSYRNFTRGYDDESIIKEILAESIDKNLIQITKRQDVVKTRFNVTRENLFAKNNQDMKLAAQTEGSSEEDFDTPPAGGGGGGGGLVQLIANLSGGEGGSDFGALFGAVFGVVENVFGPGGLDIPSLITTGTTLISGLLAGDRNFGTILGEYIALAVDGFSGGGGAINNGKFFGNLLGTIFAEFSADPEDPDNPPKPLIFFQNLIKSFIKAKNRDDSNDDEEGSGTDNGNHPPGHSDSFGFITHIVRTAVGGITSFILNASLGASGGSSQGSASLSATSSQSKGHPTTHSD